jgi:hypothetical protein
MLVEHPFELLLVLLSGGASVLVVDPVPGCGTAYASGNFACAAVCGAVVVPLDATGGLTLARFTVAPRVTVSLLLPFLLHELNITPMITHRKKFFLLIISSFFTTLLLIIK